MPQRRHQRLFVLMILLTLLCAACSVVPKAKLTYKPPFAPIRFTIDTRGHISVEWDRAMELVTFLGEFSVKGSVDIAKESPTGSRSSFTTAASPRTRRTRCT